MQEKTFERFIVKPEIRKTSELKLHSDNAPGIRRVFLDEKLLPEANLYLMVRTAENISQKQKEYVQSHKHDVDSFYMLVGEKKDLSGLKAEVTFGDKTFVAESPATIFIPKNVSHHCRLLEGNGHFINIVLNKNYNETIKQMVVGFAPDS